MPFMDISKSMSSSFSGIKCDYLRMNLGELQNIAKTNGINIYNADGKELIKNDLIIQILLPHIRESYYISIDLNPELIEE